MEQYIKKSALVAEIEKLIKKNELYLDNNVSDAVRFQKTGACSVLCDLRHFLDTLEVKEISDEYDGFLGKELKMVDDEIARLEKLKVKEVEEEPVSDFEMALTEMIGDAQQCVVEPWAIAAQWKDCLIELAKSEEPVSKDLEKASRDYADNEEYGDDVYYAIKAAFKAGAKWQEEKDKKDLELTYDDICEIMEIREDVLEMDSYENLYEEILKRFKERKGTKD